MTKKLAHHFTTHFCDDPTCGLHITGVDEDGQAICEIVMSRDTTIAIIATCSAELFGEDHDHLHHQYSS